MQSHQSLLLASVLFWTAYGSNDITRNRWVAASNWKHTSSKRKFVSDANRESQCKQNGARRDCGYPGITPYRCASVGCCWDDSLMGRVWCFYPTKPQKTLKLELHRRLVPAPNSQGTSLIRRSKQSVGNRIWRGMSRNRLVPSIKKNNPIGNPEKQKLLQEQNFVKQLNEKFYDLRRSEKFLFTTTVPATRPVPKIRNINKLLLFLFPHLKQPFKSRKDAGKSVLVGTRVNQARLSPPNPPSSTPTTSTPTSSPPTSPSKNNLSNIREFVSYVNFLKSLEKVSSTPPVKRVCELDDEDFCCRYTPAASCCRFNDSDRRSPPRPRVVGGSPAQHLRYSTAYLSKNQHHFCGGTLVSNQWVLTAAHCVEDYCRSIRPSTELKVSLGKMKKSPSHVGPGQQDFCVLKVMCHYDQCRSGNRPRLNDVALLRLSRPAVLSPFVRIAQLPFSYEAPSRGTKCLALGWGDTRGSGHSGVLKQVDVPLHSNKQCNHPDWRNCLVKSCMLCAGSLNADLCDGDSGGPLFCTRSNGLYILHGIYSWGRCGSDEKKPSVYTRTSHFVDWMASIIRA